MITKKMFALLLAAVIGVSAYAQEEGKAGSFGTELNFSPLGNFNDGTNFSLINGAKVRYFISDNMAIRGSLNFSTNPITSYSYEKDHNDAEVETVSKNKDTFFGFRPGIELHFVTTGKLSLYGGAEAILDMRRISSKTTNNRNSDFDEVKGSNDAGHRSSNTFGFGVFTGADYYLVSNKLYIGAELGLSISSKKELEVVTTNSNGGSSTTETNKNYQKTGGFGFYCNPSFRIGWNF
jgi:hypothetical protein